MASRALVFACILLYCQSLILGGSSKTIRGGSYQDGQEFQKRIEDILTDLRDSDVHSRIMAVNHAHRTHQDEAGRDNQAPKNKSIDIEEDIVETNLEQGVHLFEGDIDLTPEQAKIIHGVPTALDKRTAGQQSRMNLWHDRFIPYIVAPVLRNKRHVIRKAVDIFKRDTCLRFVEIRKHAPKSNYIYFDRRQGCHSTIGKSGFKRRQVLSLGHGCGSVGLILHEMTHAIGFWHEQARMDRNKYVKVIWGNILKGNDYNFERHDIGSVDTLGLPYDYTSLMHYGKTTFTRNGGDTLERIDDPKAPLGRSEGSFSPTDKISINALYECNKYSASYLGFSSWSSWIPMEWQCKSARQRFCMNIVNVYHREKYCSGADRNGVQVEYRDLPPSQCGKEVVTAQETVGGAAGDAGRRAALPLLFQLDLGDDDIIQNMQQTTGRCDTFAMTRVSQTNIFIVAAFASPHSRCYDSASCPCEQTCAAATNATSCECPCTTRLDYNYCSDTIKETSIPSCTSPSAKVSARPPLPQNIAELPKCFNPQCEEIESEGSCRKTFGCSWCKWEEAKELEIPFCSYDNECYGGIRGRSNPFLREVQNTPRNETHTDNQNAVVSKKNAIIIVSVVGSVLLLIISAICNCCLRRKKPEEEPVMDEEYYNEHAMQDGMYPQGYQDDGYMYQDGYEQEGYEQQDGGEYPQEGCTEEQQYFAGEELLAENEMFDDF